MVSTFCRAICARRSRRMSSSLLPLNMLPVMTSIQPEVWRCGVWSISPFASDRNSGARELFTGFRVPPDLVPRVDERRDLDHEAGFEPRRLHLGAGRGALDAWSRVLHFEVDGLRQLDADWF